MSLTSQEKARLLIDIKRNPDLALFNAITKIQETAEVLVEKEISKLSEKIDNSLDSIKKIEQIRGEKGDKGERGMVGLTGQGEKGDKGDEGRQPVAGTDFPIPKNGNDGMDGEGKEGKKGEDGSPDTPQQVVKKLNTTEETIDLSVIKGLKEMFDDLSLRITNINARRGGGGAKGGGMGNVLVETPSGTIDGANTTFTITTPPKLNAQILTVNGQVQRVGIDYTISGKTITMLWNIPTDSDIFIWYVR